MGSVKNNRTGRSSDVSQKAAKLGTLSAESNESPVNPVLRVADLISLRRIELAVAIVSSTSRRSVGFSKLYDKHNVLASKTHCTKRAEDMTYCEVLVGA